MPVRPTAARSAAVHLAAVHRVSVQRRSVRWRPGRWKSVHPALLRSATAGRAAVRRVHPHPTAHARPGPVHLGLVRSVPGLPGLGRSGLGRRASQGLGRLRRTGPLPGLPVIPAGCPRRTTGWAAPKATGRTADPRTGPTIGTAVGSVMGRRPGPTAGGSATVPGPRAGTRATRSRHSARTAVPGSARRTRCSPAYRTAARVPTPASGLRTRTVRSGPRTAARTRRTVARSAAATTAAASRPPANAARSAAATRPAVRWATGRTVAATVVAARQRPTRHARPARRTTTARRAADRRALARWATARRFGPIGDASTGPVVAADRPADHRTAPADATAMRVPALRGRPGPCRPPRTVRMAGSSCCPTSVLPHRPMTGAQYRKLTGQERRIQRRDPHRRDTACRLVVPHHTRRSDATASYLTHL